MSTYGLDQFVADCAELGYTREEVLAFTADDIERVATEETDRRVTRMREQAAALAACADAMKRGAPEAEVDALRDKIRCEQLIGQAVWCDNPAYAGVPDDPSSFRCETHMINVVKEAMVEEARKRGLLR
jgi:hypothetical protein